MAHKRKGQLTASGEWAKHLRGFLKRQFWKGERNAEKSMIQIDLKVETCWIYKNYNVYGIDRALINSFQIEEIETDSKNWRTYYKSNDSNWISFYPFSEFHGGGQSYIIMIGLNDFDDWINDNIGFENEIRKIIENK